jgi:hypothetical protein
MIATYPSSGPPPAKAYPGEKPLTFGDFVAGGYRAWGKRRANGIIRLAIKSHIIEFRGKLRFVIS